MLRMLQEQVTQQQQQLAAAQAAASVASQVPGLQAALAAARSEAATSSVQLAELQQCKAHVEQMQGELSLFKTAFKVNTHRCCRRQYCRRMPPHLYILLGLGPHATTRHKLHNNFIALSSSPTAYPPHTHTPFVAACRPPLASTTPAPRP